MNKSLKSASSKKNPAAKKPARKAPAAKAGARSVSTADPQRAAAPPEAVRAARSAQQKAAPVKAAPAKKPAAAAKTGNGTGFKKQYIKSRHAVKVTFRLPHEAAQGAEHASLVGDFNDWQAEATPMKRLRDGDFTATMELEQGREYRFRYLLEGGRWENDWQADRYEPNVFGGDDSVVSC